MHNTVTAIVMTEKRRVAEKHETQCKLDWGEGTLEEEIWEGV